MTEREDIDMLAAEYVLGTLDAAERTAVAARREREPELDAAIEAWQRRMAPLDGEVAPVLPPSEMQAWIEARLDGAGSIARAGGPASIARIGALERRVAFWRRATAMAGAVAATLALVLVMRDTLLPAPPQNFVAVFQKDDQQPAFLLAIDLKTRELVIRPVTAEPLQQRTYQLWILDQQVSPVPSSLGLIDASLKEPTRKTVASIDPAVLKRATFGISQEPPGGSPTGRPTGPALHGRLIPAAP
jgi:anti-sigma-K factor RskA